MPIPEKALSLLQHSKRHFFVGDGGNADPTMAYGAVGELSELVFLLLRMADGNPHVRDVIILAARCLQDSTAAHLRAGVRDMNEKGKIETL